MNKCDQREAPPTECLPPHPRPVFTVFHVLILSMPVLTLLLGCSFALIQESWWLLGIALVAVPLVFAASVEFLTRLVFRLAFFPDLPRLQYEAQCFVMAAGGQYRARLLEHLERQHGHEQDEQRLDTQEDAQQ